MRVPDEMDEYLPPNLLVEMYEQMPREDDQALLDALDRARRNRETR